GREAAAARAHLAPQQVGREAAVGREEEAGDAPGLWGERAAEDDVGLAVQGGRTEVVEEAAGRPGRPARRHPRQAGGGLGQDGGAERRERGVVGADRLRERSEEGDAAVRRDRGAAAEAREDDAPVERLLRDRDRSRARRVGREDAARLLLEVAERSAE